MQNFKTFVQQNEAFSQDIRQSRLHRIPLHPSRAFWYAR